MSATKHFLGRPVTPDDFVWKQDNWVSITYLRQVANVNGQGWLEHMYWPCLVQKGHLMQKLTCHSITAMLVSAPMLLNLLQMTIGMETYHFQPSPVIHGPNPYPDPLSPLYRTSSYGLETYSNR